MPPLAGFQDDDACQVSLRLPFSGRVIEEDELFTPAYDPRCCRGITLHEFIWGVSHNDLKVENIIWHEGRYKLIDFGLSKYLDDKKDDMYGSFYSPEMLASVELGQHIKFHQELNEAQDIFALGMMILMAIIQKYNDKIPMPEDVINALGNFPASGYPNPENSGRNKPVDNHFRVVARLPDEDVPGLYKMSPQLFRGLQK